MILAVCVGRDPVASAGVTVVAAHTDSPSLKIKHHGTSWRRGYRALPTENYGGPIQATWLDRSLGIAGRAVLAGGAVRPVTLSERAVIPNLAIHLNREVNKGYNYNEQDHLVALVSADGETADGNDETWLRVRVGEAIAARGEEVVSYELFLFDPGPGERIGTGGDLLVAPRLDNLAGCYTNLQAFLGATAPDAANSRTQILALFDHEEIGSLSGDGALSDLLLSTLTRIVQLQGGDREDEHVAAARSLVVSNDAAHALHPSFADKYDSDYAPLLGGGPVVKISGSYRYATTAVTGAVFQSACTAAGVPVQRLSMRSDMRPGSTVGPLSWARTRIPTVDVGLPLLAMHSIRETVGTKDVELMIHALQKTLSSEPTVST